jgi:hypothetical protein
MKILPLLIFIPYLLGCSDIELQNESFGSKPKYYRTDCIVKVELEWDKLDSFDIHSFNSNVADILHEYRLNKEISSVTFAYVIGQTVDEMGEYYLQFTGNCEDRVNLAQNVMSNVWMRFTKAPIYRVLSDKVTPSPQTIDVDGPVWIDKSDEFPL